MSDEPTHRLPDGSEVAIREEWTAFGTGWVEVDHPTLGIIRVPRHRLEPAEAPIPDEPQSPVLVGKVVYVAERLNSWDSVLDDGPIEWEELCRQSRTLTGGDPVPLLTAAEHMAALLADAPELPVVIDNESRTIKIQRSSGGDRALVKMWPTGAEHQSVGTAFNQADADRIAAALWQATR